MGQQRHISLDRPHQHHPSPPFTAGYVTLTASGASSEISVNDSTTNAMALRLLSQIVFGSVDNKLQNPFYAAATKTRRDLAASLGPREPIRRELSSPSFFKLWYRPVAATDRRHLGCVQPGRHRLQSLTVQSGINLWYRAKDQS